MNLNNSIEPPSLKRIQEMERKRSEAIEALEISYDTNTVKCQKCSSNVPLLNVNQSSIMRPNNIRICTLQNRIKTMEDYARHVGRGFQIDDSRERQELSELLKQDAKADRLRRLPLYFCRGKFMCSRCFDKVYRYR